MYIDKPQSVIIVLLFLLVLGLNSCAPDPVFRLSTHEEYPGREDIIVQNGMEYLVSDLEKSGAVLAYYRHIGNRIVLDLEVFNYSDEIVRFSPGDVRYVARGGKFERIDRGIEKEIVWVQSILAEGKAIDPEEKMLDIDIQESREEANERTAMLLDGISAGLNLAADLSDAGNLTRSDIREREARRTREAIYRAERRENYYQTISTLNEQRSYWETAAIRTTDILIGESLAGEISIPLHEEAHEYDIIVQVGEEEHLFRFSQKKFEP
jgi:hypothetical protein